MLQLPLPSERAAVIGQLRTRADKHQPVGTVLVSVTCCLGTATAVLMAALVGGFWA